MKLRRGKALYKFPPHSEFHSAWIEGNQRHNQIYDIALQFVAKGQFPRPNKPWLGLPQYISITHNSIEFYPIPDKPYIVKVRYLPPVQEW